jgi:type II secretory ATPase GspE/PulE/Tfp pilus assembly ATPase PilB-like protein
MILTIADSAVLVSIFNPILFGVVAGLWGYTSSYLDKDQEYYFLKRKLWNLIFLVSGVLGLGLWLLIPIFWAGFPVALLLIIGTLVGYHFYRNTEVPKSAQWKLSLDSFRQKWDDSQREKAQQSAAVRIITSEGMGVEVPTGDDPMVPVYEALESVLEFAIPRRAERIDMLATARETIVAVQIDGVKYPQTKLDGKIGLTLIDFLKKHAGMNVSDKRKKQTGKLKVLHEVPHDLELITSGTTRGLNLTILVDPASLKAIELKNLGMLESQLKQFMPVFEDDAHAVIVVAPQRQGMTTTLYSLVAHHDPYTTNIMSLEDEISFELEGVNHGQLKKGADAPTIARQVESLLLREPQIVFLGQLNAPDTAKIIAQGATEARFYLGLRQKDTLTALKAWVQAVGDRQTAGHAIGAVISQRLLRKLCTTCRIAYQPDPALLKKLNLPMDRVSQLYKHSGQVMIKDEPQPCPDCVGLGYRGRRAVFEVMVLDDQTRGMIAEGQFDQLKSHLRKNRMLYMQEAALNLAAEGVTSVSEISRILASEKGK